MQNTTKVPKQEINVFQRCAIARPAHRKESNRIGTETEQRKEIETRKKAQAKTKISRREKALLEHKGTVSISRGFQISISQCH